MSIERRNLYRILHVQPEAPTEIIKASYRALMSSLRAHPDLGGDPAKAAAINHAYEVLMDPQRRRAYDLELQATRARSGAASAAASSPGAASKPAAKPATTPAQAAAQPAASFNAWQADRRCPFCRTGFRLELRADTRCSTCDSPLMPLPTGLRAQQELLGRRGSERHARDVDVVVRLPGVAQDVPARLRNLSLTGLALTCGVRVLRGSVMRVISTQFDTLVGVVHQRTAPSGQQLHGQLLTMRLLNATQGVFVAVKV